MNQVAFIGRICRKIDLKQTQDGTSVLNNTMAVHRPYQTKSKETADFIPFVAWGSRAQLIEEHCKKGDLLGITGKMQSRHYEKDGSKIYVLECIVENIHFIQPRLKIDESEEII